MLYSMKLNWVCEEEVSACVSVLELQGRDLSWVNAIKYLGIVFGLGHIIQADLSDQARNFQCAVCTTLR